MITIYLIVATVFLLEVAFSDAPKQSVKSRRLDLCDHWRVEGSLAYMVRRYPEQADASFGPALPI